jgi:hypothetical protein
LHDYCATRTRWRRWTSAKAARRYRTSIDRAGLYFTTLVQRELLRAKVSILGPEVYEELMQHHSEMSCAGRRVYVCGKRGKSLKSREARRVTKAVSCNGPGRCWVRARNITLPDWLPVWR